MTNSYSEQNEADKENLYEYLAGKNELEQYTGKLNVVNGIIQNQPTVIHARSVAEDIKGWVNKQAYNGEIAFKNGKLVKQPGLTLSGKSLMHSAPLTTIAFTRRWFGEYGKYIVSIGLLIFAFSTAISWSYYGGRAVTYLFGIKGVVWYRLVYVVGFFFAYFADTTIVWTLSGITIAHMTIPNLFGILALSKEMKSEVKLFWKEYAKRFPGEKIPKG